MALARRLAVLKYPAADTFLLSESAQIRALVLWLEETQIRHYAIPDRAGLREVDSDDWVASFHQYLEDLECPYVPETHEKNVISWLVSKAVAAVFADQVDTGAFEAKTTITPEFVASLTRLADLLAIPASARSEDPAAFLQVVTNVIERSVYPFLLHQANPQANPPAISSASATAKASTTAAKASTVASGSSSASPSLECQVHQRHSHWTISLLASTQEVQKSIRRQQSCVSST